MTRLMGDAIHAEVPALAVVPGLELAAGYLTGTPDIKWTPADWAVFGSLPLVTIDQGANGSPVPDAIVRDVEAGAWTAQAAVMNRPWTAARPTIYCNRSGLPIVLNFGWRGDLWLAIPGWLEGDPLPAAPGCDIVAVQNNFQPAYDVSLVLDPAWPGVTEADPMAQLAIVYPAAAEVPAGRPWPGDFLTDGKSLSHISDPAMPGILGNAGLYRIEITWAQYLALGGQ